MTPALKFSMTTSATEASREAAFWPASFLRSMAMERLLRLVFRYEAWRPSSLMKAEGHGWSGCLLLSTRTTSAPRSASKRVQNGPASTWGKSRTRTPARGADEASLLGSDIRLFQVKFPLCLLKQVAARH